MPYYCPVFCDILSLIRNFAEEGKIHYGVKSGICNLCGGADERCGGDHLPEDVWGIRRVLRREDIRLDLR